MTPSKATRRAEGRGQPGRSPGEGRRVRTQSRVALPANLARVNVAARSAVRTRFTALLHHVDAAALERAFRRQKRQAGAGVDGITVADYERNLAANLQDLCARVHTGRYRPQPVRRVWIPKADGGQRPLGVPTLEDKIVQGAVAEMLSAIYEVAARFAQNCTLSSLGQEHGSNITQRPEGGAGVAVDPYIVAGERDVLPSKRCDVREEIVGNDDAMVTEVLDGTVEVDGIPVDDRGGDEAQAGGAEALVLEGAITDLALAVEEHRSAQ